MLGLTMFGYMYFLFPNLLGSGTHKLALGRSRAGAAPNLPAKISQGSSTQTFRETPCGPGNSAPDK